MIDPAQAIQLYISGWNEPFAERRRARFREVLADDFSYRDPTTVITDLDALSAYVQVLQDGAPGLTGETYGSLRTTEGRALFNWRFHAGETRNVFTGLDYVAFDGQGRITQIVGFFDARVE